MWGLYYWDENIIYSCILWSLTVRRRANFFPVICTSLCTLLNTFAMHGVLHSISWALCIIDLLGSVTLLLCSDKFHRTKYKPTLKESLTIYNYWVCKFIMVPSNLVKHVCLLLYTSIYMVVRLVTCKSCNAWPFTCLRVSCIVVWLYANSYNSPIRGVYIWSDIRKFETRLNFNNQKRLMFYCFTLIISVAYLV